MYKEVSASMDQKVRTTHRIIEKLEKRAESIQHSLRHLHESLETLTAALKEKVPPLQLCVWRLEQRQRRPIQLVVRDQAETALEAEKAGLMDSQRKLAAAISRTKKALASLEGKLAEITQDIRVKKQALTLDEMCLRTTLRSFQTVADTTPGGPPTGRLSTATQRQLSGLEGQLHESLRQELARQQEAVRLCQAAASIQDAAKAIQEENQQLVARCQRAAQEAAAKSERMLQDCIWDSQQMRRRLDEELAENSKKIFRIMQVIGTTRDQLKALEEPMEMCTTCTSWRKQRAGKEHIDDPVSTKLEEHKVVLVKSHEDLKRQREGEKMILQELQLQRERLRDALRDKTKALQTDMLCLAHEALRPAKSPSTKAGPRPQSARPRSARARAGTSS